MLDLFYNQSRPFLWPKLSNGYNRALTEKKVKVDVNAECWIIPFLSLDTGNEKNFHDNREDNF